MIETPWITTDAPDWQYIVSPEEGEQPVQEEVDSRPDFFSGRGHHMACNSFETVELW